MLLPLACLKRYFLKVLQRLIEFVQHYQSLKSPSVVIGKIECSVHLYSSPWPSFPHNTQRHHNLVKTRLKSHPSIYFATKFTCDFSKMQWRFYGKYTSTNMKWNRTSEKLLSKCFLLHHGSFKQNYRIMSFMFEKTIHRPVISVCFENCLRIY